jgi:MOSC domain-containing protein YiiM
MKGEVSAVWLYERARGAMKGVTAARALADHGLEGCGHARPGKKRQVLLIDAETLAEFALAPGQVKENITTRGIAIQSLPEGALVRAGAALLEITGPCEPCGFMDEIRPGLKEATMGKRGVLARVREGGTVRVGDTVAVEHAEPKEAGPR